MTDCIYLSKVATYMLIYNIRPRPVAHTDRNVTGRTAYAARSRYHSI